MANDCISVQFEDGTSWDYCWEDLTPYTGWSADDVSTGLRLSYTKNSRAWRTCQYYLKGLPTPCKWWKEGTPEDEEGATTSGVYYCSFVKDNTSDNPLDPPAAEPTGYNYQQCDFLGRRSWCDKYEANGTYDPEEWSCAAPNPYLTGAGKKTYIEEEAIIRPFTRAEISGFNDDQEGQGKGLCDCHGMGRGTAGCLLNQFSGDPEEDRNIEEKISKLPVVCKLYRPFQMGFGLIEPSKKYPGDVEIDGVTVTPDGWQRARDWEAHPTYRLPLNYKMFNNIAKFQKCQWWSADYGIDFAIDGSGNIYLGDVDSGGAGGTLFNNGKVINCTCTNTDAVEYNTRMFEAWNDESAFPEAYKKLWFVWAVGGGPVCNGARVNCPCYSGKWKYLKDSNMLPGMPVTANQILEMRFWSQDWDSQEDYDDYYIHKPNFEDPETSSIYTFTKWDKPVGTVTEDTKMQGKKLDLCQPAPLNQKEFKEDYILVENPIFYHRVQIGTSNETDQRHYPSLIRDPRFPELKPLTVLYPYYNDEVFSPEICVGRGEPGHIKRHNNIYGDSVRAVGQTVNSKKVYVINASVVPISYKLGYFSGSYAIRNKNVLKKRPEAIRNELYNSLRESVTLAISQYPDYIVSTMSDATFGHFITSPVKVVYNRLNSLLVCVDYGDGTWEWRWRKVLSVWYGGVVKQIEYTHQYPDSDNGYTNPQPLSISPSAEAKAKLTRLGIKGDFTSDLDTPEVFSTYSIENVAGGVTYYGYSIKETTVEDSQQYDWGTIGNTNKIFAEIDDINVNYIYTWDIESAELRAITDDEGNPVRGENTVDVVSLKKVLVNDDNIPPNACILEPEDDIRIRFIPSEWELYITYKYQHIVNSRETEDVVYGANSNEYNLYKSSPFDFSLANQMLTVTSIDSGSVQLMVNFKDETGRVISPIATKLLIYIVRESCRNVDIFYRYEAQGRQYRLMPWRGFCVDIKQDMAMSDPYKHIETPNCGDHEMSWYKWEGPMWFPYNVCRGYDMYDEFTVCNNCQAGYVGPMNAGVVRDANGDPYYYQGQVLMRKDYRYCGPYKYDAFGTTRGNWIAACDCGCRFWYSDASSATVVFAGYSRRKTSVDLAYYLAQDWTPPPFGNEGRELVEKFISQDYVNHMLSQLDYGGTEQRSEWMPLVMDHSVFFSTFDAFDNNPEDEYFGISEYYGFEPFRYINQLNMGLLSNVDEELAVDTTPNQAVIRYRWEDLFEVNHEGNCSYPKPTYPVSNVVTKALYYTFKNAWHAWAWQEAWKDIERNISDEVPGGGDDEVGKLDFIDLVRPTYAVDSYKKEHRRILEEGEYVLVYTGPEIDEDGNMTKYPSFNLLSNSDQMIRPFKILYDEDSYTSSNAVDWAKEGGESDTQGASDEDNPYEETSGDEWKHSKNILFDDEAVTTTQEAKDADREMVTYIDDLTGDETYGYFNRGIIINMTRDRLYYLPKTETKLSYSSSDGFNGQFDSDLGDVSISSISTPEYDYIIEQLVPGIHVWNNPSVTISSESEGAWAIAKVRINGNWGYSEGLDILGKPILHKLIKPGLSLTCDFEDGDSGNPRSQSSSATNVISPLEGQEAETYDIYLDFLLGPVEMITKKSTKFNINFTNEDDSFISINEIEVYIAEYIDVKYEWIKVWERKYVASTFTDIGGSSINLDGPGDNLHYNADKTNAGQYVNFRGSKFADVELIAVDKTKSAVCGVRYDDDEEVEISYDTLHDVEKEEQKLLYEYAYNIDPNGDTLTYNNITPYKYKNFLDDLRIRFPEDTLTIISEKLPWEKHSLVKQFVQYDFWRPGGHFYRWDYRFRSEKCTLFGPPEDVFSAYYYHVDHVGIGNPLEGDPGVPIDPGNSYYSLRFYTTQAKYNRFQLLSGGEPDNTDLLSSANLYNLPPGGA